MPPRRKSRTITFSLPPEMFEQVQRVKVKEGRDMSELLREALRLYMSEREQVCQERLEMLRSQGATVEGNQGEGSTNELDTPLPKAWDDRAPNNGDDMNIPTTTNAVLVRGIDFTSRPTAKKPIVCIECWLTDNVLRPIDGNPWHYFQDFKQFEMFLSVPSPSGVEWIAGVDFPIGLPLRFIENMDWPKNWVDYIDMHVAPLSRQVWRDILDNYKSPRQYGDREHLRRTDEIAGSVSAQKQYGVPVAMMFFEGVPLLRKAGVMIPGLQQGCPERVVVEAYPGVAVRNLLGEKVSYKSDVKGSQTPARLVARRAILDALVERGSAEPYWIEVQGTEDQGVVTEDATGDHLDALLCAVQAAWSWRNGPPNFGLPAPICPTEGCIADPTCARGLGEPN